MDYKEASQFISTFTNQKNKIIPSVASDWKIHTSYYYQQGTRTIVSSESLSQSIDCGESGLFMDTNFLSGNIIVVDGRIASFNNQIIDYNIVYTQNGFISQDKFFQAEDIVEQMNLNIPFKPSELKVSSVYKSMEDEYFVFMGNLNEKFISLQKGHILIKDGLSYENKNKYLISIDKKEYLDNRIYKFLRVIKRTPKIKLIEEFESIDDTYFRSAINLFYKTFNSSFVGLCKDFSPQNIIYKENNNFDRHPFIKFEDKYYLFKEYKYYSNVDDVIMVNNQEHSYNIGKFWKIDFDNLCLEIQDSIDNNIESKKTKSKSETIYGISFDYQGKVNFDEVLFS